MAGALLDSIINETLAGRNEFMLQEVATMAANSSPAEGQLSAFDPNYSGGRDLLQSNNIEMGQWERLFWVLIFSVMVIVAAGGNTIVVYIVATNKEMKSVTNYFLVNLSLADTMVSTLNVIFNFISMLNSHWPFGKIYCKISNFIAILSISASVFTLTAISCDRYNAILHPLRPRMSHRHAIGWILLIWTLSSALAMPNAIFSTDVEDRLTNDNVAVTCTMLWPDGRYPLSSYDHIYNIIILVVTYLVPIVTMAILYYKVGKELWGYEAIGENIDKQQRAILAKKKDVPLHYQRCYFVMYWLAMSNSMYNPIIIYFMNSKFRLEFKKILCYFICCCRVYEPSHRSSTQTTAGNQPQRATTTMMATNNRRQTTFEQTNQELQQQQQQGVTTNQVVLRSDAKDNHKSCPKVSNELEPRSNSNSNINIEDGGGRKKPLSDDSDENEPFISAPAATVASTNDNRRAPNRLLDSASGGGGGGGGGHEPKPTDANGIKIIPNDRLIDFSTTTTTTSNSIDRFTNESSEKVWI